MFAKSIKTTRSIWKNLNSKTAIFSLIAILVFLIGSYMYLVNATIMNVVAREKAQSTISDTATAIGEMEFKYITIKNSITLDLAYSKGFKDAQQTVFLSRAPETATLSYNY